MKTRLAALTACAALSFCVTAAAAETRWEKINQANALAEEGYGYLTTGRYIEAIYAFQRAAELAPKSAFLYYDLGIAYYNLGMYDRALEYYDKALSLRKNYTSALVNKASTLQKLNRPDEALAALDKALKLEPNADDIRIHRGYHFALLEQHEKAIEEYKIGVALKPDNGQGQYWLAKSLAKTGKPAEAWDAVHAAQKAGYPVDKEFLRDLEFQIPEPLGSKPAAVPNPDQGPVATEEDVAEAHREFIKSGAIPTHSEAPAD